MRLYLSGAISKQPDFKEYFKTYEDELRRRGFNDIFNPASIDCILGKDTRSLWSAYMRYDIEQLMRCDVLVFLPNWRKSKGAKIEINLCKKIGIPVVKFEDAVKKMDACKRHPLEAWHARW